MRDNEQEAAMRRHEYTLDEQIAAAAATVAQAMRDILATDQGHGVVTVTVKVVNGVPRVEVLAQTTKRYSP